MALLKDVTQSTGVVVGYWVITGCQSYFNDKQADIVVSGYASADAMKATPPLAPVTSTIYRVPSDPVIEPPELVSDLRTPLYEALMTYLAGNPDDPLHGAVDDGVLE